ncbi:hypothetical protein JG687_00008500 [Phytophthora cactorum]|uniref:Uncharacterized protein n=1 Tax=Phytophthora cactorum TaxID=29920 RepID=A0A8T1UFD0_9STRA|nr:hypothetical protein JG687_00008500 [Phytophthora cactorum]
MQLFHPLVATFALLSFGTLAKVQEETKSIDDLYAEAVAEGGKLVLYHGGDTPTQQDSLHEDFQQRFQEINFTLVVDYSKYHDVRIDNQLETDTLVPDVVALQTLQDFTRWADEGKLLQYKPKWFSHIHASLKDNDDNPYNDSRDLNTYLNAMAGTLASRFGALKKRTDEFKIGQLCLLLCTSYHVVDDKVNTIDGHFARLLEQPAFELHLDTDGGLWKDNNSWTCRCVMPSPKEDMLLHLTMTGGPFFRPFDQPLCTVISKIQPPFHYDNTEQRSNDGMRLEALTAAAIVLASHAGGFGGVAFPTFLRELLFELGVSERGEMIQLLQDVEIAGWGTRVVPFLSPPNEEWPEWLNDSSTRFGNLFRTSNEDRIDFRTTSNFISGLLAMSLSIKQGHALFLGT